MRSILMTSCDKVKSKIDSTKVCQVYTDLDERLRVAPGAGATLARL